MDQLVAMRVFLRIVETGSFTQAAASLGMPKPTVTKLVQLLEAHLRTTLLHRTTRRTIVTADGAAYYERATRLLAELAELDTSMAVSQARPSGRLRVDTVGALAQMVLLPALPDFFAQFPDIQLDIGASDRTTDLMAENVDCVIRGGPLNDPALIARHIAELRMLTCAAPRYLERHGLPLHPLDLLQDHRVVGYIHADAGRQRPFNFTRAGERLQPMGQHRVAVNEATTYLAAGLAGHGIMQLPLLMARPHLQSGQLLPVLAEWSVDSIPLHVVYPPNRHLTGRLRVFVDWVARLFAASRSLLIEGEAPRL